MVSPFAEMMEGNCTNFDENASQLIGCFKANAQDDSFDLTRLLRRGDRIEVILSNTLGPRPYCQLAPTYLLPVSGASCQLTWGFDVQLPAKCRISRPVFADIQEISRPSSLGFRRFVGRLEAMKDLSPYDQVKTFCETYLSQSS